MRVAYVCADPGVPVFGTKGSSAHVREVIRGLRRRGAEVELFTARPGGTPPADLADLVVHDLGRVTGPDTATRERRLIAANDRWRDALNHAGPFDLVYERYALWATAGMHHAAAHGIAGVLEVNAPLVTEQATHRHLVHRGHAEQMTGTALTAASSVIAVSAPVADWAQQRSRRGVHVVPNGVDVDRITPRPNTGGSGFTVGFVGTLKPWHDTGTLLQAFARLAAARPVTRLLVVGDGPERADLEHRADRLGITGRTTFTGAVTAEAIPGLLGQMDVGVAPYPAGDHYFSPMKVYEYLAAGLPVVASRIATTAKVLGSDTGVVRGDWGSSKVTEESHYQGRAVRSAAPGVLTRPGDASDLALALMHLHDAPALRRRMGVAARQQAVASHTWEQVVDRILRVALAERPQPALMEAVS